jgi:predicted metalloprotease with PDZ domain
MKQKTSLIAATMLMLSALSLTTAGSAWAQAPDAEQEEAREAALEEQLRQAEANREADEEALEARLEDAQSRMEAAAREIAVLSSQLAGDVTALAMRSIFGTEPRPMLGVNIGESDHQGVPILGVTPDGPADQAGLRAGDVLVSLDGVSLADDDTESGSDKLTAKMKTVVSGEGLSVTYLRGGLEQQATVTPRDFGPGEILLAMGDLGDLNLDLDDLANLEQLEQLGSLGELQGLGHGMFEVLLGGAGRWSDMELVTISPDLGGYFGTEEGILVVKAPADSSLQLKAGDVILDIGGRQPTSPEHAMRILRSYEAGESLEMVVIRERARVKLDIQVPAPVAPDQEPESPTKPARLHRELIIEVPEQA